MKWRKSGVLFAMAALFAVTACRQKTEHRPGPPTTTAPYELVVRMRGLVAFVPKGGDLQAGQVATTAGPTSVEKVTALLPRADLIGKRATSGDVDEKVDGKDPYASGFYGNPGTTSRLEAHHAMVRIKAKYLWGATIANPEAPVYLSLGYEPIVPAYSYQAGGAKRKYITTNVAFVAGSTQASNPTLRYFDAVPPIYQDPRTGALAKLDAECLDAAKDVNNLAARLTFDQGESLTAEEPNRTEQGTIIPWILTSTPYNGTSTKFASIMERVTARRANLAVPVHLVLSNVGGSSITVPLTATPDTDGVNRVEVEVLNLTGLDLVEAKVNEMDMTSIDHAKYYYLLAPDPQRSVYWFPLVDGAGLGGDPFCTNGQLPSP